MATAPVQPAAEAGAPKKRSRRRKTAHLKDVPLSKPLREHLKKRCEEVADKLDKSRPLSKDEMETIVRRLLAEENQPEGFLGWAMVMFASSFWRDQVAATAPDRRLFLLPHCLKHAEGCPADYDEFGLDCKTCGACSIADFRGLAEDMGYKVLVAEGSPIVLKIILSGHVDAIVGVACLNVLEKAIDKILLAGIPCTAVPLLSSDCRNTSVDEDWVDQMLRVQHTPAAQHTQTYVHLIRAAARLFEPAELDRLAPRLRSTADLTGLSKRPVGSLDPVAGTESLAYEFLAKGGKHSRPFITLAAYDALTGGSGCGADGTEYIASLPDAIKRAAMSIETFHKASLVHDDIEDDDEFRYGVETMHRRFGVPTAINVGDYLIGLGYRLVSRESKDLGADTVADILDSLAAAHMKLSEGQGAELLWRDASDKRLKPIDALKIYALKTSPAFEAALYSGVRLAQPVDEYATPIKHFSRNLGVAFQILNDLKDWLGDSDNKLAVGGDVLGGRPTLLWAMALDALPPAKQEELLALADPACPQTDMQRVQGIRGLYEDAQVFDKAMRLVDKHQERAEAVADEIESEDFRRMLYYLIDTVLERPQQPAAPVPAIVNISAMPNTPSNTP